METQKKSMFSRSLLIHILKYIPLQALAVGLAYLSGYWRVSPLWFTVVWGVFKYRDNKRLQHRLRGVFASGIAMREEMSLVMANVDRPPSWVSPSDTDHCQWLNTVISHLWCSLQPLVLNKLKELEPTLNEIMSKHKKNPGFGFKNISLGSVTPRVSGVRVYHERNPRSHRVMIDIHFFFASNVMFDCTILHKINFGLEDLEMKGCLRTIISTSKTSIYPGVEIFLVDNPSVNFDLKGVLNVGDLPGISGLVRHAVNSTIASKLVRPNKLIIKYSDKVDFGELEFPDPHGLLSVSVIEAKSLSGTHRFLYSKSKLPSPFVTVAFGSKTFTSPAVKESTKPVWNFTAVFIVDSFVDDSVTISIDDDQGSPKIDYYDMFDDDTGTIKVPPVVAGIQNLGKLTFSLKLIEDETDFKSWMTLEGVASGIVHLSISYHKLESNPKLLASDDLATILEVFIEDAKDLSDAKAKVFALLSVGEATQSSRAVPINHPVFREVFTFPVKDPKTDKLRIKLIEESGAKPVGGTELDISQLLEADNMEVLAEESTILGAKASSRLSISMRLRKISPKLSESKYILSR